MIRKQSRVSDRRTLLTGVLVSLLFLSLSLSLGSCGRSAWRKYVSEQGGFSIQLPGEPDVETDRVPTGAGEVDLHLYVVETEEKTAYFVSYTDYPRSVVSKSDPYRILAGAREATIRAQNGTLNSLYRLRLRDHPGMEFMADVVVGGRNAVLWARSYMVGRRLYQTFVMAYKGREPFEEMERFFRSFRLLDR